MTRALRVGIVGCGVAMMNPYMSTLQKLKLRGAAEVVAACDVLEARAWLCAKNLALPISPRITANW